METSKELTPEELERIVGGNVNPKEIKRAADGIVCKETCDLCGYHYYITSVDEAFFVACGNPNCPNSKPHQLYF